MVFKIALVPRGRYVGMTQCPECGKTKLLMPKAFGNESRWYKFDAKWGGQLVARLTDWLFAKYCCYSKVFLLKKRATAVIMKEVNYLLQHKFASKSAFLMKN